VNAFAAATTVLRGLADEDHEPVCLVRRDPDVDPWTLVEIIGHAYIDHVRHLHEHQDCEDRCQSVDDLLAHWGRQAARLMAEDAAKIGEGT
jgi:hypothetical protein